MGLLYIMPISLEETDHVHIHQGQPPATDVLELHNYGLPMIFWFYLLMIFLVIGIMFMMIYNPLTVLIATGDPLNIFLGRITLAFLLLLPIVLLGFFFYEKVIVKEKERLILMHKLFGIPFRKKIYTLSHTASFTIDHLLDSPNVARQVESEELRGYQNRGYFQLFAQLNCGHKQLVDRSSRKADLEKLRDFLVLY